MAGPAPLFGHQQQDDLPSMAAIPAEIGVQRSYLAIGVQFGEPYQSKRRQRYRFERARSVLRPRLWSLGTTSLTIFAPLGREEVSDLVGRH